MENKQIATVRTITGELIGGFFLYGIVFSILYGILYSILYPVISNSIPSDYSIFKAIIAIILKNLFSFIRRLYHFDL